MPPQELTVRALVIGSLLGSLLCLSNLYLSLKVALAAPVAVVASLIAVPLHRSVTRLWPRAVSNPLSLLEANVMQFAASAAGYSTGAAIASATSAYAMLAGHHLPAIVLLAWTFSGSALGILFGWPMRRQLIEIEALPFPSGTAAAETLKALFSTGREAVHSARALGFAGVVGVATALLREWTQASSILMPNALYLGVGALVGPRIGASLMFGSLLCFRFAGPRLFREGVVKSADFSGVLTWSLWPGAFLLAASSISYLSLKIAITWRASSGSSLAMRRATLERREPGFATGFILLALAVVFVSWLGFGFNPLAGVLIVAMSFILSVAAARLTGETDQTPTDALGAVAQLSHAAMSRQALANTVASGIAATTAATSADFLTALKCGYLVGATPRRQLIAQLVGCAAGSIAIVAGFYLLVPQPAILGGSRFPAPGAQMVAGIARLFSEGISAMPEAMRLGLIGGAVLGAILGSVDAVAPRLQRWTPSPLGLGLSLLVPPAMSLMVAVGSSLALVFARIRPRQAAVLTVPISSGLIVGESAVGVGLALAALAK